MNKTLEIATTVTGRFGKAVLMIGFVLGLVWSLNSMSSFTQGAQNLSPQEDRIYQKLASDPQVLPALAQMKVMAKGCKLALPRPFDLMADRLQQQQPEAYLASINEAQRTYERDMTLLGCTIFKALLDEAMRQATN